MITIEVVLALPTQQWIEYLLLPEQSTVEVALEMTTLRHQIAGLKTQLRVGIYGQIVPLNHCLQAGDRLEIYRPLIIDPKTARQRRHAIKLKKLQPLATSMTASKASRNRNQ